MQSENDYFVGGFVWSSTKSKINNKYLKYSYIEEYKYTDIIGHINDFYKDYNLNLNIWVDYFFLNSNDTGYNKISDIEFIFVHTQASNRTIDIDLSTFIDKYLIICANKNYYDKKNENYDLANIFVNKPINFYISIILNAKKIFVVDSSFSCIIYPLKNSKKLKANEINIYNR